MKRKWLVEPDNIRSEEGRRKYWEQEHSEDSYNNVFSVTEDKGVRDDIVAELAKLPSHSDILIPGCGSKALLEKAIAEGLDDCDRIVCTDFPEVVKIASGFNKESKVEYRGVNSKDLGIKEEFDAVVIINSVVSDSDLENREILKACFDSLKPGGVLIGLFPTIFVPLDIYSTSANELWMDWFKDNVDLKSQAEHDPVQGDTQIFYTPLKLRYVLKEAGFEVDRKDSMSTYFFDTSFLLKQAKDMYGIDDPDVPIYENFVVARKPII